MPIECELAVHIANEREKVWRLLENPAAWKTYWPDCVDAISKDRKLLREGSELELVVQPGGRNYTFHPEVDLVVPGKTLSLTHRGPFLQWTVAWYLDDVETGARVKVQGAFAGVGGFLMRLLRRDDSVRFSLHGHLRGLKKLAERML